MGKCPHCGGQLWRERKGSESPEILDAHKFWEYLKPYYKVGGARVRSRLNGQLTPRKDYQVIYKLSQGVKTHIHASVAERILANAELPFEIVNELLIQD